jgi:hypothetical protein
VNHGKVGAEAGGELGGELHGAIGIFRSIGSDDNMFDHEGTVPVAG